MQVYLPPMKRVPEGATQADRDRMYDEYEAEVKRMNPGFFNSDGSLKTLRQRVLELLGFR